jgi:ABC-type transport system involved in multi-copper enzyme maturation permease subunit
MEERMSTQRSLAQTLALLFGIAFLAAGILGFIPGVTTNVGDMKVAGNDSPSELLGIFQVSILHNVVHLLFGIAGIALARTWEGARTYLLGSGLIYLVLFVYGLLVSATSDANFVPINMADDWLHLVLGISLLGGWYVSRTADEIATERPAPTQT